MLVMPVTRRGEDNRGQFTVDRLAEATLLPLRTTQQGCYTSSNPIDFGRVKAQADVPPGRAVPERDRKILGPGLTTDELHSSFRVVRETIIRIEYLTESKS